MIRSVYALVSEQDYLAFHAKCNRLGVNPRDRFAKLIHDDVQTADVPQSREHAKPTGVDYNARAD